MDWFLIHTKPRQEARALLNLERQGFECFLPKLTVERLQRGVRTAVEEALFPRYLFIRLDVSGQGLSWAPIRSTLGVSRIISFGVDPAPVDDALIEVLRARDGKALACVTPLFLAGERVRIADGPFEGIEAIYEMPDGERRAMVLIEILGKTSRLKVPFANLVRPG